MAQRTGKLEGCRVARTVSGNSALILYVPEGRAAARSWTGTELVHGVAANLDTSTGYAKAGCMVYMNSTRALECWPGDQVATGYDTIQNQLLGLLLEDCNGTTTHKVAIAAAVPDTIFETSIVSQTATTTATTSATLAGLRMAASVNGSRFFLDRTTETPSIGSPIFQVVNIQDSEQEGVLYGRVQFIARKSLLNN